MGMNDIVLVFCAVCIGVPLSILVFCTLRQREIMAGDFLKNKSRVVCRKLHVDEAHVLADRVENEIAGKIMLVDVVAHIEPCDRECNLTEETCLMLKTPPIGEKAKAPA